MNLKMNQHTCGYFWHVHHSEQLAEWSNNIQERIDYIKANKLKHEIKTRLRLLKRVLDQAKVQTYYVKVDGWRRNCRSKVNALKADYNAEVDALGADHDAEIDALWVNYRAMTTALWMNCDAKIATLTAALETLHAQECPGCTWDRQTIFPVDGKEK